MIPYTIRYTKAAIEALYKIPRGKAAEVSEAIRTLAKIPRPSYAFEIELANGYAMKLQGYFITYQIMEETSVIKILLIEEQTEEPEA